MPNHVCLMIDFQSLSALEEWARMGVAEGWLPQGAALYHLAGAPSTFVVRKGPAETLRPSPGAVFGPTTVPVPAPVTALAPALTPTRICENAYGGNDG